MDMPKFPCFACSMLAGWLLAAGSPLLAQSRVRLQETFPAGRTHQVSCRVEISGKMTVPTGKEGETGKELAVTGKSTLDYEERILALNKDQQVERSVRQYGRLDFRREIGEQLQESSLRPGVRRLVILRRNQFEVPFSPDGPLTWGEIDLVRTDVFVPALVGLLPENEVATGDTWTATASAVRELTDLDRLDEGTLNCRLTTIASLVGKQQARVDFSGTVRGIGEDGPARHQLEGFFYFDLDGRYLSYLYLKGTHYLVDADGKERGRIQGTFVLAREAAGQGRELRDAALAGVKLEPDESNTRLLFEDPVLGTRFLYPRRWRLGTVQGRQVTLDGPGGSGLLITLETPARTPSPARYLQEARQWLTDQKAPLLGQDAPQAFAAGIDTFALKTELKGQTTYLEYFVLRRSQGGATFAARLDAKNLTENRGEVAGIVRSLEITRQQ